jgi:hypothetical protein
MSQLYSRLPVQSRHLFLLCLHHPVITFRFLSVINFEGIHPVRLRPGSLSHHLSIFHVIFISPSSRHQSPRLSLSAAACHPLNSLAPQPPQSDVYVAPSYAMASGTVAYGFHCTPISSVYASCFLVDVFRVLPSPYDAFVSIELSYCIIAIRLPTRNTVLLLDFSLFRVLIFSVHLFPSF